MSIDSIKEGLQRFTEFTALEILSMQMPLDSLEQLNEPIDFYGGDATDVSEGEPDEPATAGDLLKEYW